MHLNLKSDFNSVYKFEIKFSSAIFLSYKTYACSLQAECLFITFEKAPTKYLMSE